MIFTDEEATSVINEQLHIFDTYSTLPPTLHLNYANTRLQNLAPNDIIKMVYLFSRYVDSFPVRTLCIISQIWGTYYSVSVICDWGITKRFLLEQI